MPLKVAKPRKATKTPRSVIEKRLKTKESKSITKQNRKPGFIKFEFLGYLNL
jgi:ribosome-associated protein